MFHFMMDAYKGYRSRLDDIHLIYEILEEIPYKMGFETAMPPFVLPYYDGVVPEDCGISAFVFLKGGHFTIHTFSYREAFFVDLVYREKIDQKKLESLLRSAFPSEIVNMNYIERNKTIGVLKDANINESLDFGPHLFMDIKNYSGEKTLDDLFKVFDTMPYKIGMTPIMRPYAIRSNFGEEEVVSILTMIAESHICLHYFPNTKKAYFDLFSCRFFDYADVSQKLKEIFIGELDNEILISRGSKYQNYRSAYDTQIMRSRAWL